MTTQVDFEAEAGKFNFIKRVEGSLTEKEKLLLKSNKQISVDYKKLEEIIMASNASTVFDLDYIIKKLRTYKAKMLSEMTGASKVSVWRYQNRVSEPPVSFIIKLMKAGLF